MPVDKSFNLITHKRSCSRITSLTAIWMAVLIGVHAVNALIMFDETSHYGLLNTQEDNTGLSQRGLAKRLGASLGKVNFCLKALVAKGSLKISNFRNNENKLAYAYLLTPSGVDEKARITVAFLKHKMQEYELLKNEIEELKREAEQKDLLENVHD